MSASAPALGTSVGPIAVFVAPAAGVGVLREVFRALQGDFPGAIVIVLREGDGRERNVVDNLNTASGFMVLPARAGVALRDGHAYVAPFGADLAIDAEGRFVHAAPGQRADPLIASLAARNGPGAMAVALTALDEPGLAGFRLVREAGGHTIALDESDRLWADASGPRVVPQTDDEVLTTRAIGPRLLRLAPPRSDR